MADGELGHVRQVRVGECDGEVLGCQQRMHDLKHLQLRVWSGVELLEEEIRSDAGVEGADVESLEAREGGEEGEVAQSLAAEIELSQRRQTSEQLTVSLQDGVARIQVAGEGGTALKARMMMMMRRKRETRGR